MNHYDLLAELNKAGFSPEQLRAAGRLDEFLQKVEAEFAEKNRAIADITARLKMRERRKEQKKIAQPGRGPGRPAKYPRTFEEFNYWFWHEMNKGQRVMKGFLAQVQQNKKGKPLTDGERNHIRKILSELLPSHVKGCKKAMRNGGCLRAQTDDEFNCPHFFDCQAIDPPLRS
jgi:hypothetical protein